LGFYWVILFSYGADETIKIMEDFMKISFLRVFFCFAILFISLDLFAQDTEVSSLGYGFETSFSLKSGYEMPDSFSISFQGMFDLGGGLSLDFIALNGEYQNGNIYSSGLLSNGGGLLGSLFLGFPIGNIFRPYLGGGIGYGWNPENGFFAWKVNTGLTAWVTNSWYLQTGATYDNVRKGFSITLGTGIKLFKTVTDYYRNADGTTFKRTWNNILLWDNSGTPNRIYGDEFTSSEVIRQYRQTTNDSVYNPAQYDVMTSGGEILRTEFLDRNGIPIGTAITSTPKKTEIVQTQEASLTTYYYVWEVTVTRNWYTRTWYYKDRAPTIERIYQDVESAVLVDNWSRTIR